MKYFEDSMKLEATCVTNKLNKLRKNSKSLQSHDCILKGSVTAGIVAIEIPDKNISVSIATKDILNILNATNEKYRSLRRKESGSTVVQK